MSLSKFYESESSRFLEILIGIVLGFISLIFWHGKITIIVMAPIEISIVAITLGLIIVAFLLSRLSFRLITKRGRSDGTLLSSLAIGFGVFIFLVGGVLGFFIGYTESDWRPMVGGLGSLIAGFYGMNLVIKRIKTK